MNTEIIDVRKRNAFTYQNFRDRPRPSVGAHHGGCAHIALYPIITETQSPQQLLGTTLTNILTDPSWSMGQFDPLYTVDICVWVVERRAGICYGRWLVTAHRGVASLLAKELYNVKIFCGKKCFDVECETAEDNLRRT